MNTLKLAWLAGLLDGEGSVGISWSGGLKYPNKGQYATLVQMSITCKETLDYTIEVLKEFGITGLGYSYQEKDPTKHRDAHYLRINRMFDIAKLAPEMVKYSVTKKKQWLLLLEFVTIRLDGRTIDPHGKIDKQGFNTNRLPYGTREKEIYAELRELNSRGAKRIRIEKDKNFNN